jgi:lactoylglutathione lyase
MARRLMHTLLRVRDMERTLAYYCGALGMTVQVDRAGPAPGRRNVFAGYGPYDTTPQMEFVDEGDERTYALGDAYGHVAIQVEDVAGLCEALVAAGYAAPHVGPKTVPSGSRIALVRDPDGYEIELIQPAGHTTGARPA